MNTNGKPELVDEKVSLLIEVGAALAANAERELDGLAGRLSGAGVSADQVRMVVEVGRTVRSKPEAVMKEAADLLAGTSLGEEEQKPCPLKSAPPGTDLRVPLLVATGAAMAANCEPCLNKTVPHLIEAGVADSDIRRAAEIGQDVKDRVAGAALRAAEALARSGPRPGKRLCGCGAR